MYKVKKLCVYGIAAMSFGLPTSAAMAQCGTASWYHEGARTANGERYRPDGISAAHRSLPFGTRVQVTNPRTGRSVVVRINDRGPFIKGRIIDLSRGAKRVIGMDGLASVCLAVLERGNGSRVASSDDGERRAVRKQRVRMASAAVDGERRVVSRKPRARTLASLNDNRPRYRTETRTSRRLEARAELHRARIAEQRRIARDSDDDDDEVSSYGQSESRSFNREASRRELREQRRLRQEAAAEARARDTDDM